MLNDQSANQSNPATIAPPEPAHPDDKLDKNWIGRNEFASINFSCNDATLHNWRTVGCALLGDRKLTTKEHPDNKRWHLYWKPELMQIVKLLNAANDDWCFFADLPAAGLNYSYATLGRWAKTGCPLLDGRKLRTKPNPKNMTETLYSKADIARIVEGRKNIHSDDQPFVDRGVKWIPATLLQKQGRFFSSVLHKWHVKGCNMLGRKLDERSEYARCQDGNFRWLNFYRENELAEIEKARTAPLNEDRIGLSEAIRQFPISQPTLERFTEDAHPRLNGRRLDKRLTPVKTRLHSGQVTIRRMPTYSREELQAITDRHKKVEPPDPAVWLSTQDATRLLGLTSTRCLRTWSTVPKHPKARGNHRAKGRRGYRAPDGQLFHIRGDWHLVERAGRVMHAVYYMRADIEAIVSFRKQWAEDVATEPFVDSEGRWHRLRALSKAKRISYRALEGRLRFRKPVDRHWRMKPVPSAGRMRLGIHEDELAIVFMRPAVREKGPDGRYLPVVATRSLPPTAAPAAPSPTRRKRRPRFDEDISRQRDELLAAWDRAKGAGIPQKEFVSDYGITLRDLKAAREWKRWRDNNQL